MQVHKQFSEQNKEGNNWHVKYDMPVISANESRHWFLILTKETFATCVWMYRKGLSNQRLEPSHRDADDYDVNLNEFRGASLVCNEEIL